MKLVIDTDVVAAALLGEPQRGEEAATLLARCSVALAPAHWQAELANVVWKATRLGSLAPEAVAAVMSTAARLPITSVEVMSLWQGAVARALVAGQPVYDTLFVELAAREGTRVASYDRQLRRRFPRLVLSPRRLLAG